ncbi:MAG: RDD family protein [Caldilineaceae bacterium]
MTTSSLPTVYRSHAGFSKRFAAYLIDSVVILVAGFVLGIGLVILFYDVNAQDDTTLNICSNLIGVLLGWLYFAGMESSSHQGTLGKMALGIKVTDLAGDPISFGQASGRYFAKLVSGLLFGIGYLMIAFTENQQGMHDLMAGCLVVNKE